MLEQIVYYFSSVFLQKKVMFYVVILLCFVISMAQPGMCAPAKGNVRGENTQGSTAAGPEENDAPVDGGIWGTPGDWSWVCAVRCADVR